MGTIFRETGKTEGYDVRILIATILVALLAGCAQIQANNRAQEYKAKIEPGLGTATREQVVQLWGLPTRKLNIGDLEIWEYHFSFGTRGGAYTSYNRYSASSFGRSYEVYDQVTFTFNSSGILTSYKVYVQR